LADNFLKKRQIDREIAELQKEIGSLEKNNGDLKKIISYLDSEQFAEAQARLNFGLKKPGEEVVVVKSGNSAKIAENGLTGEENLSNPAKWLKYFLKIN
jgi:cell division protein FtsB